MKKIIWNLLGFLSLGMAYIGIITPGIPFSVFIVFAAYCFSKGNEKMNVWINNHKYFGPFLRNWVEYKVFSIRMKYLMLLTMSSTLIIMWLSKVTQKGLLFSAIFMAFVAIWAWRYPSSINEFEKRKQSGKKIGWIK